MDMTTSSDYDCIYSCSPQCPESTGSVSEAHLIISECLSSA